MSLRLIVVSLLWMIFSLTLIRAINKGGLEQRASQRIWMMFFLSILACSFWGEPAEMELDRHFHNLPVALYVKYASLIWVCHLYRQLLIEVEAIPSRQSLINFLAPVSIGVGLISFIGYSWLKPISRQDLRFVVIGARDAVIVLFIITTFYRGTLVMRRRERVWAMRLKQLSILLFFTSYLITTLGSISAAVMTLFHRGDPIWAARILQPFLYPTIFFFVLMLIPYPWFFGLSYFQQLLLLSSPQLLKTNI